MSDVRTLPTPAELLDRYAPRFSTVQLTTRYWGVGDNICYLALTRGTDKVSYDNTNEPTIDIRTLDIDLGSTHTVREKDVGRHIEGLVLAGVRRALKSLQFRMVRRPDIGVHAFTLECLNEELPRGLSIPTLQSYWRTFLPDGTTEQAAYLAAANLPRFNIAHMVKDRDAAISELERLVAKAEVPYALL